MIDQRVPLYLGYLPVTSVVIDKPRPRISFSYIPPHQRRNSLLTVGSCEPPLDSTGIRLMVEVMKADWYGVDDYVDYIEALWGLGHGYQCMHCGHYHPSGGARCQRCAAPLEQIENVRPEPLGMQVVDTSIRFTSLTDWRSDFTDLHLELWVPDEKALRNVFSTGEPNPMYTVNIHSGLYLCQWCGMAVSEGDDCPGCGGVRMPLMEIVNLKRECLYCGDTVVGDYWCKSCGARLSGRTLSEVMCK